MKQLTVLFLVRDNEVLLAMKKRGFGEGRWNGVGGKVEPDETIKEAMVRECQEEIEVTPLEFEQVAEIDFNELHLGNRDTLNVHVFVCGKWSGEPVETEEMSPQWFKKDHLPLDSMWDDDSYWLPRALAGEKLRCEFTMDDNDKVTDYTVKTTPSFS